MKKFFLALAIVLFATTSSAQYGSGYGSAPAAKTSGTNTWTGTQTFLDNKFILQDDLTSTKKAVFQLSGLVGTRTFTVPNLSGTLLSSGGPIVLPVHSGYTTTQSFGSGTTGFSTSSVSTLRTFSLGNTSSGFNTALNIVPATGTFQPGAISMFLRANQDGVDFNWTRIDGNYGKSPYNPNFSWYISKAMFVSSPSFPAPKLVPTNRPYGLTISGDAPIIPTQSYAVSSTIGIDLVFKHLLLQGGVSGTDTCGKPFGNGNYQYGVAAGDNLDITVADADDSVTGGTVAVVGILGGNVVVTTATVDAGGDTTHATLSQLDAVYQIKPQVEGLSGDETISVAWSTAAVAPTATIMQASAPVAGDYIVAQNPPFVGGEIFRFVTTVSNNLDVRVGATGDESFANLVCAMNDAGCVEGVDYIAGGPMANGTAALVGSDIVVTSTNACGSLWADVAFSWWRPSTSTTFPYTTFNWNGDGVGGTLLTAQAFSASDQFAAQFYEATTGGIIPKAGITDLECWDPAGCEIELAPVAPGTTTTLKAVSTLALSPITIKHNITVQELTGGVDLTLLPGETITLIDQRTGTYGGAPGWREISRRVLPGEAVTVPDEGTAAAATYTIQASRPSQLVTCSDADGCDLSIGSVDGDGYELTIIARGAGNTLLNGGNVVLSPAADLVLGNGDNVKLVQAGGSWFQTSYTDIP